MLVWLLFALSCSSPRPETPSTALRVASSEVQEGPFTNRLAEASSPYLAQHGHNPVDWYPWGPEALEAAKTRQVPVFLSIGYAACHWCHVMEEESFEDPVVAAFLNENFVAVKVDREERPDVDAVYMDAVHALNGNGGWPASLWLTPDGEPFFAGTYFPPAPRAGRPSFMDVLVSVDTAWNTERSQVDARADELVAALTARASKVATPLPEDAMTPFVRATVDAWDPTHRGWGARQFPMSPRQQALVDAGVIGEHDDALRVVAATLDAMDRGGLHDQVGGGFHRYTVDARWQIPHFEKMLYDNAQLLGLYATASVALGEPRFAVVARRIAAWMTDDLYDTDTGLFHSSLDADIEGEEGTTYLWTPAQLREVLGDGADDVATAFAVTDQGNFEGRTVLTRPAGEPPDDATLARLLAARDERPQPRVDTKAVVAYNALAVEALARAGRLLHEARWVGMAEHTMDRLLASRGEDGRLPRTVGGDPAPGVLDDHAFVVVALIELHQATGDARWLREARAVWQVTDRVFWDADASLWRHSADPDLIVQRVDVSDGAEPSGVSRAIRGTLQLRALGAQDVPAQRVDEAFAGSAPWLARSPASAPATAVSHALASRPAMTVVVAGTEPSAIRSLTDVFHEAWRPDATLMVTTPSDPLADFALAQGKDAGEHAARAFVCYDGACQQPVSEPAALRTVLSGGDPP